jgi:NitT/TauT family transport system ATP-binding protein
MNSIAVDMHKSRPHSLLDSRAVCRAESTNDGLRASSIGFSYAAGKQHFEIFRDVSLDVPKGRSLALFGPNGTGKTTLMQSLAGLRAVRGKIALSARKIEVRSSTIGYVPQAFARSFYPWASLETNILISLQNPFRNLQSNRRAIRDAHDALGLKLDLYRRPTESSGGMLQQAALIRALARRPDLLIADEPFSALDFDVASRIREGFVQAVREMNICSVLVCHELQDILEVCDLVLAIPGRPFSTNPSADGCYHAEVFANPRLQGKRLAGGKERSGPTESPFTSAVRAALGGQTS